MAIPRLGDIVHYTSDADPAIQYAALITKVIRRVDVPPNEAEENGYDVWLRIYYEEVDGINVRTAFSSTYARKRWSWPPKK